MRIGAAFVCVLFIIIIGLIVLLGTSNNDTELVAYDQKEQSEVNRFDGIQAEESADFVCSIEPLVLDDYVCEPCVTGSDDLYIEKDRAGKKYYSGVRQGHPQRGSLEMQSSLCSTECDRDPYCVGFAFEQSDEFNRFFCVFDTRGG